MVVKFRIPRSALFLALIALVALSALPQAAATEPVPQAAATEPVPQAVAESTESTANETAPTPLPTPAPYTFGCDPVNDFPVDLSGWQYKGLVHYWDEKDVASCVQKCCDVGPACVIWQFSEEEGACWAGAMNANPSADPEHKYQSRGRNMTPPAPTPPTPAPTPDPGCTADSGVGSTCHGHGTCSGGQQCECDNTWASFALPRPDDDDGPPTTYSLNCPYNFDQTGCCFKKASAGCHPNAIATFIKYGVGLGILALGAGYIKWTKHKMDFQLDKPPLSTTGGGLPVDEPYDAGFPGKLLRTWLHVPMQDWHFGVLNLFMDAAGRYFMISGFSSGKGDFTFYTTPGGDAYGIDCECAQFSAGSATASGTSMAPTDWWFAQPGNTLNPNAQNLGKTTPSQCGTLTQLCGYEDMKGTAWVVLIVFELLAGIFFYVQREHFRGAWVSNDLWLATKGTQLVKWNQTRFYASLIPNLKENLCNGTPHNAAQLSKPTIFDWFTLFFINFLPVFASLSSLLVNGEIITTSQKFVTHCDKGAVLINIAVYLGLGGKDGVVTLCKAIWFACCAILPCFTLSDDTLASFFREEKEISKDSAEKHAAGSAYVAMGDDA
jgi:hypothetical protein